jgi:hypothetical protein
VDDADDDRYSRAPEPDDVVRICRALNEAGEILERQGVSIPIAGPHTLIRLKDTPRPQDALDLAYLEGVLRARAGRA